MKPRNAIERKFVKLASQLPPVSVRQIDWAYKNCFSPMAVYTMHTRKVRCLCCGHETKWDKPFLESFLDVDEYSCEYCGHSMCLKEKKHTNLSENRFFTVISTFKGFQVFRTFDVCRDNSHNEKLTDYSIDEVFQHWILPDGKEVITGRPHSRSPFHLSFSYHRDYEIKKHNASITGYYQMEDLFDVCGNVFYPIARVTPLVRRNGWRPEIMTMLNRIALTDAVQYLLKCPTAEMLCKTGQMDLFLYMIREGKQELDFLHSVRIANRRGYIVEDASMWLDMLRMADRLGLDTHNPSVVCPEDLLESHHIILHRFAKVRKQLEKEDERASALLEEKSYQKKKGAYFGICLVGEGFTVSVIDSVVDILEEGEEMHHCVYQNKYHQKDSSLILSARDNDNNRLETVELSLQNFKVLQSRAKFNKVSPLHNAIVSLVESNSKIFRKAKIS